MSSINTGVAIVTALNGLVLAGVLMLRWKRGRLRRRRTELVHILMAAVALLALWFIERIVLRELGFNFFGIVRLIYVHFVVLLPILGALLLVHRWVPSPRRPGPMTSRAVMYAALLSLPLAPLGAYASLIEPSWLEITHVPIVLPTSPASERPIRICVLADIQTERITEWERAAVAALMAQEPDIILITGDMLQLNDEAFEAEAPAMRELLSMLQAPGGVFAVEGDADPRGRTRRLYKDTGVQYLVNDFVETTCRGQRILIGGCEREFTSKPSRWMLGKLADRAGGGALRIVVSHDPGVVAVVSELEAGDLVVAGHTHGGQVRLPWIGPLLTATTIPRANCAGLSEYKGVMLYVSRGVGMVRAQAPPIRFLCRPEISVLDIQGTAKRIAVGGTQPGG